MKYPDIRLGDVEAVWNMLGGEGGVARFLRGELVVTSKQPVIPQNFPILALASNLNPETFIGEGWKIFAEDTDQRGEALGELDLSKVVFKTMLEDGESSIKGEEKFKRSKSAGHIRLGGKALKACWDNRHLLPESWKKDEEGNTRYIYFDGIVLLNPYGRRCVLYLYFYDGQWVWSCHWLGSGFDADYPSAVLES